jgi:hypothetical protein
MRRATKISKTKTGASNREKKNYAVCDVAGDFPIINLNSYNQSKKRTGSASNQ